MNELGSTPDSPRRIVPSGFWPAHFSLEQLRARPRWLVLSLVTAGIYGFMPAVHLRVFGPERVQAAVVQYIEGAFGARLGEAGRQAAGERAFEEASIRRSLVRVAGTLLAVLMAGFLAHVASLGFAAELSAAQVLSVIAVAFTAVAGARIAGWLAVTLALREGAVAIDWRHVAPGNLAVFAGPNASALQLTLLGNLDMYLVVGAVVTGIGLQAMDTRFRALPAFVAGFTWMGLVMAFRLTGSFIFRQPIF